MWWVTVNDFYRQMSELQTKQVVYLDDYDYKNENQVVITFDGVYKNILEFALPILKHFNYPFELFVTSDYISLDNEFDKVEPQATFASTEELKELVKNGGRLQWHTRSHPNLQNEYNTAKITKELKVPDDLLILDKNGFRWFAYPYGNYNEVVVNEVNKIFTGAVSCNQGNEYDKYILNRKTVVNNTKLRKEKIACIIASYNYGQYLIEAIESVLRQTIVPDEILITDDNSIDDTRFIGESYAIKYPDLIRYNKNEQTLGIVNHFNKAVAMTNSEFVMILGADNRLVSNYIEECIREMESNAAIGIAYTDFVLFGNRAKIVFSKNFNEEGIIVDNDCYKIIFPEFESPVEMLQFLEKRNFIHGSSMFKREAFDKVSGYQKTEYPEDHNFFTRIIKAGYKAKKAKKAILEYRQHSIEQANNLVYLYNQLNLYKSLHTEKIDFENSRLYSFSHLIYKAKKMPKKKLFKAIIKRLLKRK